MQTANLLDCLPSLTAELPARIVPALREHAEVRVVDVAPGLWSPPRPASGHAGHLGLLVVEGWLWQEADAGGQTGVDLLGACDLLRPWVGLQPPGAVLPSHAAWSALVPTRLAVLDGDVARRLAAWPEVAASLTDRLALRLDWHVFLSALRQVPSVAGRVELLLRGLADRWGRATPDGVVIDVPLAHAQIGALVGARRASVSTAVAALSRQKAVMRHHGAWIVRHEEAEG